jgi:hypothetical protein
MKRDNKDLTHTVVLSIVPFHKLLEGISHKLEVGLSFRVFKREKSDDRR